MHPARLISFSSAILCLSAIAAAPARATLAPTSVGAVELQRALAPTHDHARQQALSEGRAWRAFQSHYGPWSAVWNEATGSPHLAAGPAIALDGAAGTPVAVDRAVRRFVAGRPELFGSPTLETVRAQRVHDVWYLSYRQSAHGIPVLFEDWEFRVSAAGRLMAFGADAHRIGEGVATRPALTGAVAREAARVGVPFDPTRDRIEGGQSLFLLPYPNRGGVEYRLVYDVRVMTTDPPHSWLTLVDASSGEVLWRRDQAYSAIGGHVSGFIHPALPTDPLVVRPFAHENVTVGSSTVVTDANGAYSASVSGPSNVTTRLLGPFCNTLVDDVPRASFTATGQADGSTVDVLWASARQQDELLDAAERDAFYHVNVVHDFEKAIDPGLGCIDFPLRVDVLTNLGCGAFTFLGFGMFLGASKFADCPPTASMPGVIYHEYTHATNDTLYRSLGAPFGMLNPALHEGTADVTAALMLDDPLIGNGLHGPGTTLRRVDVANRWPEDKNPDPHNTGLIIAAAFWDLRHSLGTDLAAHLYHFAKYGLPDDPDDAGVAMSEYFVQTLIADDDDGNLANGTPHLAAINAAFDAHGIGTGYFVSIAHTPIADQAGAGPFPVTATIALDAGLGFGHLDVTSPTLHYSINGAAFVSQRMLPMGGPGQFAGSIPAASGAAVRYYLDARDNNGGTQSDPPGAPADAHVFLAGTQTTAFLDDMESNPGWTTQVNSDDATDGRWKRDDPVGTTYFYAGDPVQPEFDHTPDPGTECFVTGNGHPGDSPFVNDVDGGKTTLTTSSFSALGLVNPVVEYFRWFVWAGETSSEDSWTVDLSNNGGASWVNVETFRRGDPSWRRVAIPIAALVTLTADMRLRFVVDDVGLDTAVEGGLDDFRLLSLGAAAGAASNAAALPAESQPVLRLELAEASPNPFRSLTRLRYRLPERSAIELAVYDLSGRRVRWLEHGMGESGEHTATWDGRDQSGQVLPSGSYYLRLSSQGRHLVRRVVVMR